MIRYIVLLVLPSLLSFNFTPMSQSIDLGQSRKGAQFLIENEGATNIAVELTVKGRSLDEVGNETLTETKDVSIFPPQIIIPPGEKRTVRVSYNGKDIPEFEKNFRVIAEQLPLKVDPKTKDQAGIKMLMKYVAALYASPPDTKAEIKLLSYNSNDKEMKIVVENKGKRHQLINNPVIRYIHKGKKGELNASELSGMAGENVLAGHKRIFTIKTTHQIPEDAKIELKIND